MSVFWVMGAFADAGNPILGTINGEITSTPMNGYPNAVTVTVRGQWHWYSHNSDCNTDRAGAGVGIIWNDPNGADRTRNIGTATRSGNTVTLTTTTAQTFNVGDHITVSGVTGGTGYNGNFVITARDNTHVKYTASGSGSGSGGTVTDTDVFNGWIVQKSPITAYVGTQVATALNPVDRMVHPSDVGNKAEGYPGFTGQTFVNPSPADPNSYLSWKGGCGREPETATASPGGPGALDPSGTTCADATLICGGAAGTDPATGIKYGTNSSGHPWGSWGYTESYSHVFAKRSDVGTICVNYYDVHGGGTGDKLQLVNGAKEITVDGNGDNSIGTNAFNPVQGANCISFPTGALKVTKTSTKGNTPLAGATFLFKQGTTELATKQTDANGVACIDGLNFGNDYSVQETAAPDGYKINDSTVHIVTVNSNADCSSATGQTTVAFSDTPLSKLEVKFFSSAGTGVTSATITCKSESGTTIPPDAGSVLGADQTYSGLVPNSSSSKTYTCPINIDP